MATLSTFPQQDVASNPVAEESSVTDSLVAEIWVSGIRDNLALIALVCSKALLGVILGILVAVLLPVAPGIGFYAAFSAGIAMLYLAGLTDARSFRDVISLLVPALFVLTVLLAAGSHPLLVGITLFTHVLLAFSAGFSRSGGSLHQLGLWPFLFGVELVALVFYVNQLAV